MSAIRPARRRPRLLVVDDVEAVRLLIERGLRAEFEITLANDGLSALAVIDAAPPFDLILTDLRMPNLDGFGLYDALRKDPDLARRIVIMSASAADPDVRERRGHSEFCFISKPFTVAELKDTLHATFAEVGFVNRSARTAAS